MACLYAASAGPRSPLHCNDTASLKTGKAVCLLFGEPNSMMCVIHVWESGGLPPRSKRSCSQLSLCVDVLTQAVDPVRHPVEASQNQIPIFQHRAGWASGLCA